MNRTSLSWLFSVALTLTAGCRDLDYPEGDEAVNEPPVVEFLLPAEADVTTLNPIISLDARDPNGIASVTLLCGNAPVYVWAAPPFLASVDLSNCAGTTDASTGRRAVTLRAVARDVPGLESAAVERSLFLDVAVAQLRVEGDERVAPQSRYVLRIESDRTLGAVPTVRIASQVAQISERTDLQTAPLTVFDAIFDPMPGVGADLIDGGTPTQAQLEELERTFVVEVEGRATSGNVTRVVREVTVSRIAWERPLPISWNRTPVFESDRADPAATSQGLVLPFEILFSGNWLPGVLAHEDGAFIPFADTSLLDDSYSAEGLDAEGRALFTRSHSVTDGGTGWDYAFTSSTGEPLAGGTLPQLPDDPLRRVGTSLCGGLTADAGTCAFALPTSARAVVCLSPAGVTQSPSIQDPNEVIQFNGTEWAVSGDTYAAYGFPSGNCGDERAIALASPTRSALAAPTVGQESSGTDRLVPLGAGRFFGVYWNFNTAQSVPFILNADGSFGGRFFSDAALGNLGLTPAEGLPERFLLGSQTTTPPRILTRRETLQETVFEAWEENGDAPVGAFSLPGYVLSTFEDGSRPGQVYTAADGSLYLQLVLSAPSAGIKGPGSAAKPSGRDLLVALDRDLRPRWMYRFAAGAAGLLYANEGSSHLYYVDTANQRVIAFSR